MRWRRGQSEVDTEQQAKFSGAEIDFGTVGAEVSPEDVADKNESMAEFEAEFEDPTAAQLLAERHPEWPPIKLRIHFSPHGSSEDHRGVSEYLQGPATRPDIYLFEATDVSLDDIAAWQRAADRKDWGVENYLRANPHFVGSPDETQLKGLVGSGIAVGSIDLREENAGEVALNSAITKSFSYDVHKNFEQSLQNVDRAAKNRAELQGRREAIMTQRLEPEIARLIAQRPELGSKDKLNIFLTLGSIHTTLFRDLKQAGFEIDRTSPETPYVYSPANELQRVYQFGAEARLDADRKNELLARAFLEKVFMDEGLEAESYDDSVLVERYIAEQFGYDEIKDMHSELVQGANTRSELLSGHWRAKGFARLPQNPAEVHELAVRLRAKLRRKAGLKKDESSSADAKTGLE
jgi:hypothetical protein